MNKRGKAVSYTHLDVYKRQMQKTILATRAALAVPKAKIDAEMTKGKSAKAK